MLLIYFQSGFDGKHVKYPLNPLTFLVWHDYLFKVNFLTQAQLTFASVASFEPIFVDPFWRDEKFTKIEDHETENSGFPNPFKLGKTSLVPFI